MEPTAVEHLVRSIYRLGLVQRAIARHASVELASQGFTALAIVHKAGPVRVSDVAHKLSVDLSVASRQLAALETAGYVTREPDPDDRRAHRVSATEEGTRVLRESHRRMVEAFGAALGAWSEDEITELAAGLDRLREDYTGTTAAPRPQEEITG
jgi:DNA-binding MarR family transcriptional regulator